MSGECEWNPVAGVPSTTDDDPCADPATIRCGRFHLCVTCSTLPVFRRFAKVPLRPTTPPQEPKA